MDIDLQKIEKEVEKLSIQAHFELIEVLVRQLRNKNAGLSHGIGWSELYGIGRDLWHPQDAQDYVNALREER